MACLDNIGVGVDPTWYIDPYKVDCPYTDHTYSSGFEFKPCHLRLCGKNFREIETLKFHYL